MRGEGKGRVSDGGVFGSEVLSCQDLLLFMSKLEKRSDGAGPNCKKDRWGRSMYQQRQMGPVQIAGVQSNLREGQMVFSAVPRRTDGTSPHSRSGPSQSRDESAGKANDCPSCLTCFKFSSIVGIAALVIYFVIVTYTLKLRF